MELLIAFFGSLFYGIKALFGWAENKSYERSRSRWVSESARLKALLVDDNLETYIDSVINNWINRKDDVASIYELIKNDLNDIIGEEYILRWFESPNERWLKFYKDLYLSKRGKISGLAFDFGYRIYTGDIGKKQLSFVAHIEDNLNAVYPRENLRFAIDSSYGYGNNRIWNPFCGNLVLQNKSFAARDPGAFQWRSFIR